MRLIREAETGRLDKKPTLHKPLLHNILSLNHYVTPSLELNIEYFLSDIGTFKNLMKIDAKSPHEVQQILSDSNYISPSSNFVISSRLITNGENSALSSSSPQSSEDSKHILKDYDSILNLFAVKNTKELEEFYYEGHADAGKAFYKVSNY